MLHYQPIVDIQTGDIVAVEALLRWHHPKRGWISPATFIPIAEETNLIQAIGDWVLRQVCEQSKVWRKKGSHMCKSALTSRLNNFCKRI